MQIFEYTLTTFYLPLSVARFSLVKHVVIEKTWRVIWLQVTNKLHFHLLVNNFFCFDINGCYYTSIYLHVIFEMVKFWKFDIIIWNNIIRNHDHWQKLVSVRKQSVSRGKGYMHMQNVRIRFIKTPSSQQILGLLSQAFRSCDHELKGYSI